jgi:hypothetical protein
VGESPVAEAWALSSQVFEGDPGVRLVVFGRLRVAEASHEIAARVGLASRHLSADEIALVGDAGRRREVARQANALVFDRCFSTAMSAAALVGVALARRWVAPDPGFDD